MAGSFPSLMEAAASKPKKKNKGQTFSLSELASGLYVGPGGRKRPEAKGLTTDELMMLPTGPRERTGEEPEHGRLGGGFRDYGRNYSRPDREPREGGSGGGFGREREGGDGQRGSNRRPFGDFHDDRKFSRGVEFDEPSRADEAESWASGKKFVPSDSFDRNRREAFDAVGGPASRADGVDNWGARKKLVSGGAGYADTDRWGKREAYNSMDRNIDRDRDRPRIFLNPPSRTRRDSPPPPPPAAAAGPGSAGGVVDAPRSTRNPFGLARPREAVLAERGQDWRKMDAEIDSRSSARPRSEHSSRPTSAHSTRPASPAPNSELEAVPRPRPKINPFGDARPREVLLEEKGKDWRKMDFELEHLGVDRPETEEEHKLKEEINALKKVAKETISSDEVKVNRSASGESSIQENQTLREQIILKEKRLELMIRELDDKVRFGQRGGDRPGSAAGRSCEYIERAGFRSGRSDGGLSHDSFERPRSRGGEIRGADIWMSSSEDRRGIHGNWGRSFTDTDRFS